MQPDQIQVDFSHLNDGGANLKNAMKGIQIQLEILDKDVRPIHESWVQSLSSAGAEYDTHRTKLRNHIHNLSLIIDDFSIKTSDAGTFQAEVEKSITKFFH